jgi:hypothetical protein
MNLRLMALNIRQFVPDLSLPVIKERINVRYQQILGSEDWEFLKDSTTVALPGIHSSVDGETVSVTNGSAAVVGTGTTFTAYDSSYFIRVGTDPQPYTISAVSDATNLTMETTYGGSTDTDAAYSIFRTYFQPSVATVGEITSVVYRQPLGNVSEYFLNSLDPERSSTGEPQYIRNVSKSAAGGLITFEIWPIPDQDYVVTVFFKKTISALVEDTDSPVFRPELIESGALFDCYRMAFAITQNPAYIGLARDARADYAGLLREAIMEDVRTTSMPNRVRDVSSPRVFDDNFALSHDVYSF